MRKQGKIARYSSGLAMAAISTLTILGLGSVASMRAHATVPSWSYTGSLNIPSYLHTATLLSDGKVLVAGGVSYDGVSGSAELYDPVTGKWKVTGSLNVARYSHKATLLRDGRVLVVGGSDTLRDEDNSFLNSAELYDPQTGSWSVTGSLNTARAFHTATLLQDGKVLVAGGGGLQGADDLISLSTAELYDPETGTWSFTGSLNAAIEVHTATLLQDGKVLVARGDKHAELYDPDTGSWSSVSNASGDYRFNYTAVLLLDGRVLLAGGYRDGFNAAPWTLQSYMTRTGEPGAALANLIKCATVTRRLSCPMVRYSSRAVLVLTPS